MKKKMFLGLLTFGILAAGCSNDDLNTTEIDSAKGAVRVTISSDNPSTRATGNPSQSDENKVNDFTVYVFNNSTGNLEAKENITDGFSKTIEGLSLASSKKVVVLVNEPEGFPSISNYSQLENPYLNLDSQNEKLITDASFKGLFMSGEKHITLKKDETVSEIITVRRVVAKIKFGGITISPEGEGITLDKFVLGGVSIQHAREKAIPMSDGIQPTGDITYTQGIVSYNGPSDVVEKAYLNEYFSLPGDYVADNKASSDIYFYVFPNNNDEDKCTLLTVYGQYDGKPVYYPFRINEKSSGTGGGPDGTYIQRNKIYTLNVTLKKLALGGEGPNIPNDEVSLGVEVDIAPWEGSLEQDVIW